MILQVKPQINSWNISIQLLLAIESAKIQTLKENMFHIPYFVLCIVLLKNLQILLNICVKFAP